MKEMFDLDYLGKDLTGNSEIQSEVDRALAFMKLEKWDKALEVCEGLIDKHPESPCSWFVKARLATMDFTFFGLSQGAGGRQTVAQASECLEAAVKLIDDERKEEYKRLYNTYSDYLKKDFADFYTAKFTELVDSYKKLVDVAKMKSKKIDYGMFMVCEAFSKSSANENGGFDENSFYGIPVEIINEIGTVYPSVRFASLHILFLVELMKPYFKAQEKRNHAQRVQEARFEQRKGWNQRQGFGYSLDADEVRKLSKECPVYELSYYYTNELSSDWSLAKLIKDNSAFVDVPEDDERVKEVFKAYFKFFGMFELPFGDLKNAGIPSSYLDEIVPIIEEVEQKMAQEEKERKRIEQERAAEQEKEREKQAEIERKQNKGKYLNFVFLIIGIICAYFSFNFLGAGDAVTGGILLIGGIILVIIFRARKRSNGW